MRPSQIIAALSLGLGWPLAAANAAWIIQAFGS